MGLRYSICSEIFKGWSLKEICQTAAKLGYEGLEIAPFMFADDVRQCSASEREEMRKTIEGEGMVCSGLHWLLASPKGLHITHNNDELRNRSWDYLGSLIHFCGDLGASMMILGSPFQRDARDGWTVETAKQRLIEGLKHMGPIAANRGVCLMMEAVSSKETNVVNTLDEAAEIVDAVGHPNIQTMFDFHNAADELGNAASDSQKFIELLDRHFLKIRHVHVNEVDGRHPGTGGIDFKIALQYLLEHDYDGWVSLEVFDFSAGSENIARETIEFLKKIEDELTTKV